MPARLEKFCKVMVYGTLGLSCGAALAAAILIPGELDVHESEIAAVYLALLIGAKKAFNAEPILGNKIVGAIATFAGAGLLPAAIINVAVAQIGEGQSEYVGTLIGYGYVGTLAAIGTFIVSLFAVPAWNHIEKRQLESKRKETGK